MITEEDCEQKMITEEACKQVMITEEDNRKNRNNYYHSNKKTYIRASMPYH